jgi:hypothetical protein
MKQRRSNVRRASTAAFSSSAVNRPLVRARMIARPASENVNADVTRRVPAGSRFVTSVSCSRSAATSALDSTYFTCVAAARPARERVAPAARERPVAALRFATIRVDQRRCRTARQADVRPILEGIAGLQGRTESPSCQQVVPSTAMCVTSRFRRDQFGDHASMSSDRDSFAGFYAAYVPTQVVFQLSHASGGHVVIIATCGHER